MHNTINPGLEYSAMVLLIDDQAIVGHAVRNLLAHEPDINMHYCANPMLALEVAAEVRPTVILQDLVMPTIDGLELVRMFRNNPATAGIPIIVLSSKEDPVTKRDAFAAGANDYLVKLPDKLELIARIRYHSRAYLNQIQRDEAHRALRESQQTLLESNTKLLTLNQELEEATRVKAEFLANMSHEIRTPLTGVLGMTTLLVDTPLTKEQESYVETIRSSGNVLLELINDILDFSKIEAGKLEMEEQPFDLAVCIEEALELVSMKASEKNLALGYRIDPTVPPRLLGDLGRIRQILVNLAANAVKFTHQGEVSVLVSRSRYDNRLIQFAVRDTGIGIPRDRQDRLFQSFSQADASITRNFGGTGLGLAISKRLCERMGGSIWVESEAGQGSTFYFTANLKPAFEARIAEGRGTLQFAGKRVLIVEDKPMHREILKSRSESLKMHATVADSAAAALERIRNGEMFDAVVFSSRLPDMDVLELAQRIRTAPGGEGMRLILMTPQHIKRLYARARQTGVGAFLHEPVRDMQFREVFISVFETGEGAAAVAQKAVEVDADLARRFPMRILVAEDNTVNQKVALNFLRKLGYTADIVSNGMEVISSLERQQYDLVFLDIQMPEMDGDEAARRICQKWTDANRPRLVAMTAAAMHGDRERCISAGMDDYLSKPISISDLKRKLEQWGHYSQTQLTTTH
jgi:signal transduction histidine kinase